MGQGYSLTTLSAGSAGIDVPELADLSYEKSLGDARFMKTIRARHAAGLVVVKVLVKPYSSMKLDKYIAAISRTSAELNCTLMKVLLTLLKANAVASRTCPTPCRFIAPLRRPTTLTWCVNTLTAHYMTA